MNEVDRNRHPMDNDQANVDQYPCDSDQYLHNEDENDCLETLDDLVNHHLPSFLDGRTLLWHGTLLLDPPFLLHLTLFHRQ
mmetsp:Transcript_26089/g.25287  ORF Transcript_26089/g.25287 Transcript_26089/m.25287 type:complete len:81 (-) Transcript_26089:55-297(-)